MQRSSNIQPADSRGYTIWINFYETEELYLKMEQEKKEAQEKVREEYKKRQEALKKQQKETAPADASKRTGA